MLNSPVLQPLKEHVCPFRLKLPTPTQSQNPIGLAPTLNKAPSDYLTSIVIDFYFNIPHKVNSVYENVSHHISKQRLLQPSATTTALKGAPEGIQDAGLHVAEVHTKGKFQ